MTLLSGGVSLRETLLGKIARRVALTYSTSTLVLLVDQYGNAIQDAETPGAYWTITPSQNEANP